MEDLFRFTRKHCKAWNLWYVLSDIRDGNLLAMYFTIYVFGHSQVFKVFNDMIKIFLAALSILHQQLLQILSAVVLLTACVDTYPNHEVVSPQIVAITIRFLFSQITSLSLKTMIGRECSSAVLCCTVMLWEVLHKPRRGPDAAICSCAWILLWKSPLACNGTLCV